MNCGSKAKKNGLIFKSFIFITQLQLSCLCCSGDTVKVQQYELDGDHNIGHRLVTPGSNIEMAR